MGAKKVSLGASRKLILGLLVVSSLQACRTTSDEKNSEALSAEDTSPLMAKSLKDLPENLYELYLGKSSLDKSKDCALIIRKDENGKTIAMELLGLAKAHLGYDKTPDTIEGHSWVGVGERYLVRDIDDDVEKRNFNVEINFKKQRSIKYDGLNRIAYMSRKFNGKDSLGSFKWFYPGIYAASKILLAFTPKMESFIVANNDLSKAIGYAFGEGEILKDRPNPLETRLFIKSVEITCENMKRGA